MEHPALVIIRNIPGNENPNIAALCHVPSTESQVKHQLVQGFCDGVWMRLPFQWNRVRRESVAR